MRGRLLALLLPALLVPLAGCQIIAVIGYYTAPRQWQHPEFVFPEGSRVAVLIDAAQNVSENPVFTQALAERTAELLHQGKEAKVTVLPYREVIRLRQTAPEFHRWPVQRIGRELGVDYVLQVIVDSLQLNITESAPVIEPRVLLRLKLIDVDAPAEMARVWPEDEREGREVEAYRPSKHLAEQNPDVRDVETAKLAFDTGFYVTMPFLKIDTEEKPPVAP